MDHRDFGFLRESSIHGRCDLCLHAFLDFVEMPRAKIVSVHPNIHRK